MCALRFAPTQPRLSTTTSPPRTLAAATTARTSRRASSSSSRQEATPLQFIDEVRINDSYLIFHERWLLKQSYRGGVRGSWMRPLLPFCIWWRRTATKNSSTFAPDRKKTQHLFSLSSSFQQRPRLLRLGTPGPDGALPFLIFVLQYARDDSSRRPRSRSSSGSRRK